MRENEDTAVNTGNGPQRRNGERDHKPMTREEIWFTRLMRYGIGTALGVVLLYFFLGEFRADQRALRLVQTDIITEQQNLARGILKVADKVGEQQMLSEKILLVLRVQCVHEAASPSERSQCLREQ